MKLVENRYLFTFCGPIESLFILTITSRTVALPDLFLQSAAFENFAFQQYSVRVHRFIIWKNIFTYCETVKNLNSMLKKIMHHNYLALILF